MMRDYFHDLAAHVDTLVGAGEIACSCFSAEHSDFIRFNKSAVRQATNVRQVGWTLALLQGGRRIQSQVTLTGNAQADKGTLGALVASLRDGLDQVPEDPYLLVNEMPQSSEHVTQGALPDAARVIDEVLGEARGLDLVGHYAGGPIWKGFANTLGQRNWHAVENFNFGWCLYHDRDKAVKSTYAGSDWQVASFRERMAFARAQLSRLGMPPRELKPGAYRAYLAPTAMTEILSLLNWGAFGLKSQRTKQSALVRMVDQGARLHPALDIAENTAEGVASGFQGEGFVRPPRVPLVSAGRLDQALVSPRSAREYEMATNGANAAEIPESLDVAAGTLPQADALKALDTGLLIGNLWYLNYSDRTACRMTGMTRFATFWVEDGEIRAPLSVMRFDDTAYRMLGDQLEALTAERDLVVDSDTYGERSTLSMRTPGALLKEFTLTL
jgi:predicted Zn-dependent protease